MEVVLGFLALGFLGVMIASHWVIFDKAGQPGWACIVPLYNGLVLLRIVDRSPWWLLAMFIPFVSFFVGIMIAIDLANKFGKSGGFVAGMILFPFIFYPILAFGEDEYEGRRRKRRPVRRRDDDEDEEDDRPPPRRLRRDEDERPRSRRRPADDDDDPPPRPRRRPVDDDDDDPPPKRKKRPRDDDD